jgi:hypothetical protein
VGLFGNLFGIGINKKPRAAGPTLEKGKEHSGTEFRSEAWRKARVKGKAKSTHLVHTDAAFDEDELASFLLGIAVQCRSSWIDWALWNEGASELVLTVKKSGRAYTFPGQDYEAALDFAKAYSKGHFYWIELAQRFGTKGPVALEPEDVPGRARRVL